MTGSAKDVQTLRLGLAQARDAQITRVVAMVDAMPARGAADELIAPLRPRLAQLRPVRPLTFSRVLFTPFDPVIVPSGEWRLGAANIPRGMLAPVASLLRAAAPELEEAFAAVTPAPGPCHRATKLAAGSIIWPRAALAMEQLVPPPNCKEVSGLPGEYFKPLLMTLAAILHEAAAIEQLAASRRAPDDAWLRGLLQRVTTRAPEAVATLLAVLLARMPDPSQVLGIAAERDRPRQAADGALDHTLSQMRGAVSPARHDVSADPADAAKAALETARIAALLAGLEASIGKRPERRREIEDIRRNAAALCRRRFESALAGIVAQAQAPLTASHDDDTVAALEAGARDLRRLETAGRRLGDGEPFDALLRQATASFQTGSPGLGLADRVRLIEILAGPDEALAVLEAG